MLLLTNVHYTAVAVVAVARRCSDFIVISRDFHTPTVFTTPVMGDDIRIHHSFVSRNLEWWSYQVLREFHL